jgi:hypothetical protein
VSDKLLSVDDVMLRVQLAVEDLGDYAAWNKLDVWDWVAFFEAVQKRMRTDPTLEEIDACLNAGMEE